MIVSKKIKTFSTHEFMDRFFVPEPELQVMKRPEYGIFFSMEVQELIKLSKLPVPPSRSTTHILIYLTSGVATMKIGLHEVQIEANQCLVVPAGQVFSFEQYEVNEGFITVFSTDFLIGKIGSKELIEQFEFLTLWGNPKIKPSSESAPLLRLLFERILKEYQQNGLLSPLIQPFFTSILCELNTAYQPLAQGKSSSAIQLTNGFKALLYQHIRSKHRVSDYAHLLHVTPNHLNKIVKEVTSKSPSKWIDETLVLEAKVLLFQSKYSISEISAELGIYDASYFSRLFKKYVGTSPASFRQMIDLS